MGINLEQIEQLNKEMEEFNQILSVVIAQQKVTEQRLNDMTELLRQSNEDVSILLLFIKSKGLLPPKLHKQLSEILEPSTN